MLNVVVPTSVVAPSDSKIDMVGDLSEVTREANVLLARSRGLGQELFSEDAIGGVSFLLWTAQLGRASKQRKEEVEKTN